MSHQTRHGIFLLGIGLAVLGLMAVIAATAFVSGGWHDWCFRLGLAGFIAGIVGIACGHEHPPPCRSTEKMKAEIFD